VDTHWLRKANKYLMMMRVLLGWDCRTFFMWTARSWRLSIAGNNTAGTPRRLLRQSNSKDPGGLAEKTLTHTSLIQTVDVPRPFPSQWTHSLRGNSVCVSVCCRHDMQSTESDAKEAIQATTGG